MRYWRASRAGRMKTCWLGFNTSDDAGVYKLTPECAFICRRLISSRPLSIAYPLAPSPPPIR